MGGSRLVSALPDHLGYWLRMVSNAVSHGFARKLDAVGVTVAEWVFLRMLYDVDSIAPSLLAERMGMTKGAITKLAERLVGKGLVTRAADTRAGGRQSLALTAGGRALVPKLAKIADENDASFFEVLDASERRHLARILKKIGSRHRLAKAPTG